MLLSTFTFLFRDVEDRIVDYSYGNLRVGNGVRRMGITVLLDTGVVFMPQTDSYVDAQEGLRGANWPDVIGVSVRKKLIGREVTLATRSMGHLTARLVSPSLAPAIEAAWRRAERG